MTTASEKRSAIVALHQLIDERLFKATRWWPEGEVALEISRRVESLGLYEPAGDDTTRDNGLGKELNVRLMTFVFLGMTEAYAVAETLWMERLISKRTMRFLWGALEVADPEFVLRGVVQAAYFKHFNPSGRLG